MVWCDAPPMLHLTAFLCFYLTVPMLMMLVSVRPSLNLIDDAILPGKIGTFVVCEVAYSVKVGKLL